MATKIITKNSSTTTAIPTAGDLVQGELAVNVTDKRLFTEDSGGAIVELGTSPSTIDINAGTIDGTTIGGTTAAAMSGTTGAFANNLVVSHPSATGEGFRVIQTTTDRTDGSALALIYDDQGTTTSPALVVQQNGTGAILQLFDGAVNVFNVADGGAATFSDDVGIGTNSPAALIHGMSGDLFLTANSTAADSGQGLFFQSTTSGWATSSAHAAIYGKRTDASNGYLRFDTRQSGTTQEAMRIDTSGNLGIGTSSPTQKLHIGGAGFSYLRTNSTTYGGTGFDMGQHTNGSIYLNNRDNTSMIFQTNNTEAMQIDASGNLLVGKTANDNTTAGHRFTGSGFAAHVVANDYPLLLNRLTSDGSLLPLR